MADMDTVASRLRQARKAAGATQAEWGALVGRSQSGYARWESGETEPSLTHLAQLCTAARLCLACVVIGPHHRRWRHERHDKNTS